MEEKIKLSRLFILGSLIMVVVGIAALVGGDGDKVPEKG